MKISFNILSIILVVLILILTVEFYDKKSEFSDLKNKHDETMVEKRMLKLIQDSLRNVISEVRITSLEKLKERDSILQRYKDSMESQLEVVNNYVYSLDNESLAEEYKTLIDVDSGVSVVGDVKDTSFIIEPINIRKTVELLNQGSTYKHLYEVSDVAYDSLYIEVKMLSLYKDAQDSLISSLEDEIRIDSVLICDYANGGRGIEKQHKKQLRRAKIRYFLIGAGTGVVGVLFVLL